MADPLDRYQRQRDRLIARSVLDRLLDANPDAAQDPPQSLAEQIRDIRESIRRDLEALLNTRCCPLSPPATLGELKDALVSFGVESILSANLATEEAKTRLARAIEQRVALFETRLSNVRVAILRTQGGGARALRLRIEATFRLHEGMPSVHFESVIDPSSQCFAVEPANG